jgi:hypothetical protein
VIFVEPTLYIAGMSAVVIASVCPGLPYVPPRRGDVLVTTTAYRAGDRARAPARP